MNRSSGSPANSGKRFNHAVSNCLLKNWLDESGQLPGHHYFDLETQKYKFELGRRAKFAQTEYLYMPLINADDRSSFVEDWFSVDEGGLGLLCKAAAKGNPDLFPIETRIVSRAVRACVSFGSRSLYHLTVLAQIPRLADEMEDETAHQAIAKMALLATQAKMENFYNWDFVVAINIPGCIPICDQPFMDFTIGRKPKPLIFMPLSPHSLFMGTPPDDLERKHMTFSWRDGSLDFQLSGNATKSIIATARHWLVGQSKNQVVELSTQLSPDLIQQRIASDRIVLI